MTAVTELIDKLTCIELSVGVASDAMVRDMVIDAQDCALQIQGEVAEALRIRCGRNMAQVVSGPCLRELLPHPGWHRAFGFAAIRLLGAAFLLSRR